MRDSSAGTYFFNDKTAVISPEIGSSPQDFWTFSFNHFPALLANFKAVPSTDPKLLSSNQEHPAKKVGFSGQII